ncbi:hypothetical protein EJ04DRAFT_354506 [Polyplosphaeria fusca]|uniref:Uncharacterized protein n=1 Tax=Polyplosphaeria fusca TaxID=682080 RepID=A0A9P4R8P6_9PLEO|nr:hypothetical protein EJ04DRAFT_354506 [Polyplosphaeria fusca]
MVGDQVQGLCSSANKHRRISKFTLEGAYMAPRFPVYFCSASSRQQPNTIASETANYMLLGLRRTPIFAQVSTW